MVKYLSNWAPAVNRQPWFFADFAVDCAGFPA